MIYKNGKLLAVGEHLSFNEVEVITAAINLDDIRAHRSSIVSRGIQADRRDVKAPRIMVEDYVPGFRLTCCNSKSFDESPVIPIPTMVDEEEMGLGLSRYIWDYLCRSTAGGLFLPLSGGVDSGSTSLFVYYMCNKICEIVNTPFDTKDADKMRLWTFVNKKLTDFLLAPDLRGNPKRPGYKKYVVAKPYTSASNARALTTKQLVNIVLHTCNMPTKNNTEAIRAQASDLAKALGSYHLTTPINDAFIATKNMVAGVHFGYTVKQADIDAENEKMRNETPAKMMEIPRYKTSDGDWQENLAIQNVQARLRMITAYYMAQILPLHRWNHDYGSDEGGINGWDEFYKAKKAALAAAQKNSPNELEEKLSFSSRLTGNDKNLQDNLRANRGGSPFLLVLASSNADEALRGFFTKYDAGSADLNPIGSFAKTELRKFMKWIMTTKFHNKPKELASQVEMLNRRVFQSNAEKAAEYEKILIKTSEFEAVDRILNVTASPELTPTTKNAAGKVQVQDDEVEIEMTYQDLYELGLLRKRENLGPYSMFLRLCKDRMGKPMKFVNLSNPMDKKIEYPLATPTIIAELVKRFFNWYGRNRSKMTILTPGIHATNYSPDDNRFDQRPFLYPSFDGSYQHKLIKKVAEEMEAKMRNNNAAKVADGGTRRRQSRNKRRTLRR
jgi:NAD+ synthase (glutamine-hydrolysing)